MNRAMYALLFVALAAVGCKDKQPDAKPETAAQTAAQEQPKPKVELTFSFQPAETPSDAAKAGASKLAELVSEKTGYGVATTFPTSYGEAIKALKKGKAHVVLLSGWAFLHAHHNADASLLMAEERGGAASFDAVWFVPADSKLEKPADLAGKRIAFTSPTSAPGFLFPYAKLIEDKVVKPGEDLQKSFKEVYFVGGEAEALRALLDGKVDAAAGAAFAPSLYLKPEEQAKLKPIGSISGVPTHVLAVKADLDLEVQEKLQEVLGAIDDKELLMTAFGAEKLIKRSHGDHMMPMQNAEELVGARYAMPAEPEPEPAAPKGLEGDAKATTKDEGAK